MPEEVTTGRVVVEQLAHATHEWDRFVRESPHATFCHLSGWLEVLRDTMQYVPRFYLARDESGAIRGVLPAALLRSRWFGNRLVSTPLLNYGGPLGTQAAIDLLVRRALRDALAEGATLELRTREPVVMGMAPDLRKVTVLLPLADTPEQMWDSLRSKLRSQIRRPIKDGLEIRFGRDQLQPFYEVLCRNMRDLGTPVLPRELFTRIADVFADEVVFATVYQGDRPVAAGAGFTFGGEFEITWASALREYSRSSPNMLLYWGLMEEMIRRGVKTFNFGRCTPGQGTHRFKQQWGGHDVPLPWIVHDPRRGTGPGGEPGRLAALASLGWKHLPHSVARHLGPPIARRLPWW